MPTWHAHMSASRNIRTFAELNRHAIKTGAVTVYRMWLILRWLDIDGSGVVDRRQFMAQLRLLGMSKAHLRTAQARQTALYGADVWWTSHSDKIEYRSLEAVCERLQILPGRSVYVPVDGCRSIESFSAMLYAAWHSPESRMISRERLEDLFGVTAQTLRRWERSARVNVEYNVVEILDGDHEAAARHIAEDDRPHKQDAEAAGYVFQRDGKTFYRTVNKYAGGFTTGNRGRSRKASKRANYAAGGVLTGAAEKQDRIFFDARRLAGRRSFVTGASVHAVTDHRGAQPSMTVQYGDANVWQFSRMKPTEWRF